ncbi:hypothetical protein, partial [Salmonella enterica]|uniref:hypothetical protein n=1 Tax=Salmonella enterica TaxID=28901 RepID=UPI003F4BC835
MSVLSPDFTTWPLPLMALSKSPPVFSSSVALSVTSPVPSASTSMATSVPPVIRVPPVSVYYTHLKLPTIRLVYISGVALWEKSVGGGGGG